MAPTDERRGQTVPYAGIGLALGGGVGILIAVVAGWPIAAGIVVGASVGLLVGAATGAQHSESTQ